MSLTITQDIERALAHHRDSRFAEAEAIYRHVLARDPDNVDALHLLAMLAMQVNQASAAVDLAKRAVSLSPATAELHLTLGNACSDAGRHADALAAFTQAVRLRPLYYEAYNNLANSLKTMGRFDDAIATFRVALQARPDMFAAWNGLGGALVEKLELAEAIQCYEKAIALNPDYAEANHSLATTRLLLGDFKRGLSGFEWRWRTGTFRFRQHEIAAPQWTGQSLEGKSILIWSDEGFGDAIQQCRFIPLVAARARQVTIAMPEPLRELMTDITSRGQWLSSMPSSTLPSVDYHCPMNSLPLAFGVTPDTIPSAPSYLSADPRRSRIWAEKLGPRMSNLRIGLAWAGSPTHADDLRRSIPLSMFAPLAQLPGVDWHSLQKREAHARANLAPAGMHLIDQTDQIQNFADTAALISQLDLVICVDTSVAHLAAALGKPVWMLVAYRPDWHWMLDRSDSPWYPTLRLYRQRTLGDWPEVIRRVKANLAVKAEKHRLLDINARVAVG